MMVHARPAHIELAGVVIMMRFNSTSTFITLHFAFSSYKPAALDGSIDRIVSAMLQVIVVVTLAPSPGRLCEMLF
jgi:hypothetical protein